MLTCRWILAVLIIAGVVGVAMVSAVEVGSVRIIPSYGVINYEPGNLEGDAMEKPNIIEDKQIVGGFGHACILLVID